MRGILLMAFAAGACCGALRAQAAASPEPLSAWRYFKEIQVPRGSTGVLDFALDLDTLDKSSANQADLRLYDGAGREIPYVRRVRRAVQTSTVFPANEFNRGVDAGSAQVTLDLSEQPLQHNEVEIDSAGDNFRRLVDVEGSANDAQWSTLASSAIIFNFSAGGRRAQQNAVTYPMSRYRYLRVRVHRDPQVDRAAPELLGVRVRRLIEVTGETISFAGKMEDRDADRLNGRPASIWRVDLNGRIPIQGVVLTVGDAVFSRPFQLEAVDDPSAPTFLASGELTRENGAPQTTVNFPERYARRLKLTVTDDRNPPLSITEITAQSSVRQVVFESESANAAPLQLYYGNPKAQHPHYDLATRLPADLKPAPTRLVLGRQIDNPVYRPEPRPFSERAPWLVYVVLGVAVVALAAILLSLVRASALTT